MSLNDSVLHGRNIKVASKRTNLPYFMAPGYRGGRGRGARGGYVSRGGRGGMWRSKYEKEGKGKVKG